MRRAAPILVVAVGAALAAACHAGPAAEADVPAVTAIDAPTGPDSGEPNVTAGPDGLYLSWIEPGDAGRHQIRFARWNGDGWTGPHTIIERGDLFVNWADFPSLFAGDGVLAAHWLERSGPAPYAYDVRMALSRDGGLTWSEDIVPHRDGTQTEHGFVSLFPFDGAIGAVWLDGRAMVHGGPMALRFTTIGGDGTLGDEVVLDDRVCECCQTGAAVADAGPVIVYRGLHGENTRDIHVVRRVDGEWTLGRTVHDDGWVIPGCPVNGPAVTADGDRVAVAWFTGATPPDRDHGEAGRVLLAFSDDGGATFGPPVRIDEGGGMGRVDLLSLGNGRVLVAWLERSDDDAAIRTRIASPDGIGPTRTVANTLAGRASGFPRMARHGDDVLLAWTETGDPTRVRVAHIRRPERGP